MIFRLEYCNKESVTARVDIQKGGSTPIYTVEGTADPFVLFYNNDKGDKSGSFRSSGADINIYETAEFNIDELKTSNETEISVKYYINNILNWSGFVIPDFFSETITGGKGVVSMVASDRLGTLKGATLSGLSAKVSNRELAEACLAQTGLSLPLYTMADFAGDGANIFNSEVLSQRMVDTKGRNVSCYDILSSILEETNSLIVQRNGAWYIINKLQLEAGSGSLYSAPSTSSAWVENTVSFDEVSVGARRTIKPVAATVGVYHEHGGGRLHPDNYDFSQGLTGWTPVNGFVASINDKVVDEFEGGGASPQFTIEPTFTTNITKKYLVNLNYGIDYEFASKPYIRSSAIPIVYPNLNEVNVSIDINATAPYTGVSVPRGQVNFAVVASNGSVDLNLNSSGIFEPFSGDPYIHKIDFFGEENYKAVTSSKSIKGLLRSETGDLSSYNVTVRIYGHSQGVTGGVFRIASLINSVSVNVSTLSDAPKGNIFKTTQGANYTKTHEIPTVLWGDYLTSGLNGYFYDYPIDDTSSLYRPTGELHSGWTAYGDPDTLPLLQHITRQKSRMFSVAHDLLSADITASTFDPLSTFVDCGSTRYVVVSARFDFLRSNVSVELEEVAYATNSKRDYIYSYFGDGEEGISSIGGITGGTTSTGGGLTSEQLATLNNLASWWKLDEVNDAIYSEKNVYSQQDVSAYGIGSGSGGSGDISKLLSWAGYTSAMADYYAPASLLVPFYNDMQTRVGAIENTDYAELDSSGKVLSSQLPSYVDDVMEFTSFSDLPSTGESGKIYITIDTNRQYRWTGTTYAEISSSLALGETSSTAYRGDRGKAAYDHTSLNNNPHGVTASQVGSYTIAQADASIANAISAIEIGGRNLIKNSSEEWVTVATTTFNYIDNFFPATVLEAEQEYTFSWEAEVVSGTPFGVVHIGCGTSGYQRDILYSNVPIVGKNKVTFKPTASHLTSGNKFAFRWYNGGAVFTFRYRRLKLEKGNKSTDWTPAPEDKLDKSVFDDLFEKVEVSTGVFAIKAKYNFYGVGEVSAYGIGSGGSGGGDISKLLSWSGYTSAMADYYVPASLLVPFYNDYNGHGHDISDIIGLQSALDGKASSTHTHSGVYEPVFSKNTAFNKNFGTTAGTVAEGNHTHNQYLTAITKAQVEGVLTGNITTHTHSYLPLTGGTLTGNINITPSEGSLGVRTHRVVGSAYMWPYGNILSSIRTGLGFGWYDTEWIIGNIRGGGTDSYGFGIGYRNADGNLNGEFRIAIGGIAYLNNVAIATVNSNVASATKLETARTIWGQSFDGTGNVTGALSGATTGSFSGTITSPLYRSGAYNWVSKTGGFHSSTDGYQTGGLSIYDGTGTAANFYRLNDLLILGRAANQSLTIDTNSNVSIPGNTTTNRIVLSSVDAEAQLTFSRPSLNYVTAPLSGGISFLTNGDSISLSNSMMVLSSNGNVGIGKGFTSQTTSITAQLHVRGDILATGTTTTTKVIFSAAGWSLEQVGTELQMKHNGVVKQRMLSDGSIVATGEVTAFVSAT